MFNPSTASAGGTAVPHVLQSIPNSRFFRLDSGHVAPYYSKGTVFEAIKLNQADVPAATKGVLVLITAAGHAIIRAEEAAPIISQALEVWKAVRVISRAIDGEEVPNA